MAVAAGWRGWQMWDTTLRDCADPARVQTRAGTSLNIQTKHGRIIRAIIQHSSQSTQWACVLCRKGITYPLIHPQIKLSEHCAVVSSKPFRVSECLITSWWRNLKERMICKMAISRKQSWVKDAALLTALNQQSGEKSRGHKPAERRF